MTYGTIQKEKRKCIKCGAYLKKRKEIPMQYFTDIHAPKLAKSIIVICECENNHHYSFATYEWEDEPIEQLPMNHE